MILDLSNLFNPLMVLHHRPVSLSTIHFGNWNIYIYIYIYIYIFISAWSQQSNQSNLTCNCRGANPVVILLHWLQNKVKRSPLGIVVNMLDCNVVVSVNSTHIIAFIFKLTPFKKVWTLLSLQVWVRLNHYNCFIRMDFAFNNIQKLIYYETKNKPNKARKPRPLHDFMATEHMYQLMVFWKVFV